MKTRFNLWIIPRCWVSSWQSVKRRKLENVWWGKQVTNVASGKNKYKRGRESMRIRRIRDRRSEILRDVEKNYLQFLTILKTDTISSAVILLISLITQLGFSLYPRIVRKNLSINILLITNSSIIRWIYKWLKNFIGNSLG